MNRSRRRPTRITAPDAELAGNRVHLEKLVAEQAPQLPEMTGIGPVVAATVLVAWSHPGRVRSETAFVCLAGTCPIPASSGNTQRDRLNCGGDRQLNKALTTIALVRMRCDPKPAPTWPSEPPWDGQRKRYCVR